MNFNNNKIQIISYPGRPGVFDTQESLCDNKIEAETDYGALLNVDYNNEDHIIFKINTTSDLYCYCVSYYDGGGSTSSTVSIYKKGTGKDEWIQIKTEIPTSEHKWSKLYDKLPPGTYKIKADKNYISMTELYADICATYGLYFNNNIYTMTDNPSIIDLKNLSTLNDSSIGNILKIKEKIKDCETYNIIKTIKI